MLRDAQGHRAARWRRSMTPANSCWTNALEAAVTPRTRLVAVTHISNVLGTVTPVDRYHPHRPGTWRPGAGRRLPGRAAPGRRRAGPRLRLLRLHRPQGLRADRHRRALRQGAICSNAMPPFLGGGDMIRSVTFEKTEFADAAEPLRGRHAPHLRRHRPGGRRRLRHRARLRPRSKRMNRRCCDYATERLTDVPGLDHRRPGETEGQHRLVHHGGRPSARHRHDPGPAGHRRPRRPSLRRNR